MPTPKKLSETVKRLKEDFYLRRRDKLVYERLGEVEKMTIKVTVDSNLFIKDVFEPPVEVNIKDDEDTLRDVLQKLSDRCPYLRFTEGGEMGDGLRHVYINGKSHFQLPEGLKRRLRDGDTVRVEAYMEPLAGG
ncbi:MAG: hypothetical protein COW41_02090 [Deltaproteobacteria bacterium CG17_big_fil_post_rev_8_21_14_2_50_51_6]|nr:MAG: hypothetical protein COW41_02090 [Deltaproteobacteria bacterium CG17_big_fil_post_rev_8_21_14_2_50_51_6]